MSYSDITPDVSAGIPNSGRGTKPKALTGQTSRQFPTPTLSPPPPTLTPPSTPTPTPRLSTGPIPSLQTSPLTPSSSTNSTPSPPTSTLTPRSSVRSNPNPPSSTPTSKHAFAITMTMSVVGVVILIVITIIAYKYRQNKRQKKDTSGGVGKKLLMSTSTSGGDSKIEVATTERFIEEFSKDKPMRFSPSDLIAFTHNYTHHLGSGGFGEVYKGETYNGVQVAVKVLKKISDSIVNEQFVAELCSIGRTYHINLVKLYGFCFENDIKALVYEYMENGSLESCLADRCKLNWEKLYHIAIGTARGIRYLHEECHKMIIHYDIKPGNVLLCRNFSPKVADFGMAELWDRESTLLTVTQERGTPGFIAPELCQPLSVTYKCDVYSYGMLLFQIIGSKRITEGKQADSLQTSTNWVRERTGQGEFASMISSCGIEEKDRPKAKRMCEVALMCVHRQPEKRPLMSTVLMMLEGEKNSGVQGSLYSNAVPGELDGSKPDVTSDEPYRKAASGKLGGSKSELLINVESDEPNNNVASGELCSSKSELLINVKSDEPNNNIASGELGGSKSELLINVKSDEPNNNIASDELGGAKSKPIINMISDESDSNVASDELGGSKPDSYNNVAPGEFNGSKSEPSGSISDSADCYMYTVRENDILP